MRSDRRGGPYIYCSSESLFTISFPADDGLRFVSSNHQIECILQRKPHLASMFAFTQGAIRSSGVHTQERFLLFRIILQGVVVVRNARFPTLKRVETREKQETVSCK